jgi:small subunit ribosomal protein S1
LSLKAIGEEASRHEVEQYKSPSSSGTGATLGEIINWKQGR